MPKLLKIVLLFLLINTTLCANSEPSTWYSLDNQNKAQLNVSLFMSTSCKHCHKADAFFKDIEQKTPWLHIQYHFVNQDKQALELFNRFLANQNLNDFAVPSIFFCDSRWVGFVSAQTTGEDILKGLNYCKQQIEKNHGLNAATVDVLKRLGNATMYNSSVIDNPSPASYVAILALMDALNPCSIYIWATLIALMFIQSNKRLCTYTGLLFLGSLCVAHGIQQYTNFVLTLMPWFRIAALLIGSWGIYLVRNYYQKRLLGAVPALYIVLFAAILVMYQQTCLMNWSYVFSQWLDHQQISLTHQIIIQLLYQVIYSIPLLLIVGIYSLCARFKSYLVLIGWFIIAFISLSLIIYPSLLSYGKTSSAVIILLVIAGYLGDKYSNRLGQDRVS